MCENYIGRENIHTFLVDMRSVPVFHQNSLAPITHFQPGLVYTRRSRDEAYVDDYALIPVLETGLLLSSPVSSLLPAPAIDPPPLRRSSRNSHPPNRFLNSPPSYKLKYNTDSAIRCLSRVLLFNLTGVGEVIDEDVLHARVPFVARTQQCFTVKAGIDGLLDIAWRTICDTSEGLPYRCNHNDVEEICITKEVKCTNGIIYKRPTQVQMLDFPSVELQLVTCSSLFPYNIYNILGNLVFTSFDCSYLNVRNKSAAAECYIRTEVCLESCYRYLLTLLNAIREDVSALTPLAEVLCLLDMIINSFAYTISTKPVDRYTRPEFTSGIKILRSSIRDSNEKS
ncbi:unnamed protein product [Dovyalis caffra]|uniref:Uncharacterized protein n=1 Tax=Dovyalis caffra TaxID=77055 RepID=A0AAV1STZ8_9ROSI|nr:unnamed protein product [Dovyalis caffra]